MHTAIAASVAHVADLKVQIADLKARERNGQLDCCAECSGLNTLEYDLVMTEEWLLEVAA
jgi:hypothetical protein